MKYLKQFQTKQNAIDAADIVAPNLTYCDECKQLLIGGGNMSIDSSMRIVADGADKIKYAEPVQTQTWVFKDNPDISSEHDFVVNFTSNGIACEEFIVGPEGTHMFEPGMQYVKSDPWLPFTVYDNGVWEDESYKTITLAAPATGELLTYLQNNASTN